MCRVLYSSELYRFRIDVLLDLLEEGSFKKPSCGQQSYLIDNCRRLHESLSMNFCFIYCPFHYLFRCCFHSRHLHPVMSFTHHMGYYSQQQPLHQQLQRSESVVPYLQYLLTLAYLLILFEQRLPHHEPFPISSRGTKCNFNFLSCRCSNFFFHFCMNDILDLWPEATKLCGVTESK